MSYSTLVAGPSTNQRRSQTMSASSRPSTRIASEPQHDLSGVARADRPAHDDLEHERDRQGEKARDERAEGTHRQARKDRLGERDETCERSQRGGVAVFRGSGGSHDPCGIGSRRWRRGRRARRAAVTPDRTERADCRAYAQAGSAQPRSPGVPNGSRRMAATGVTATAIVCMASSFDGCPRSRGREPSSLNPRVARVQPLSRDFSARAAPVRQPLRARAGCA